MPLTEAKGSALGLDEDLASTANGEGASLIGVEDVANNFTADDLEAILIELAGSSVSSLLRVKGADLTTADVAAGVLTFGSDGDNYDFTGTDEITGITTVGVGTIKRVHTDGVATITHHATGLICQGGLSFKTEAGGMLVFYEYAVGNWRVYYFPYAKAIDTSHDHAYANISTDWLVATVQIVGDKVKPTSPDGRLYAECTTAGTTHASTEPTWPIRAGDTVSDNGTVWTMRDGGGKALNLESMTPFKPWELIESQTAIASTSIDFEDLQTSIYKSFKLVIRKLRPASSSPLRLRVGIGVTPTYQATGYDYVVRSIDSSASPETTIGTNDGVSGDSIGILLSANNLVNTAAAAYSGEIKVNDLDDTGYKKRFTHLGGYVNGADEAVVFGSGVWETLTAITAIRILMDTGVITSGEFSLYGMR